MAGLEEVSAMTTANSKAPKATFTCRLRVESWTPTYVVEETLPTMASV